MRLMIDPVGRSSFTEELSIIYEKLFVIASRSDYEMIVALSWPRCISPRTSSNATALEKLSRVPATLLHPVHPPAAAPRPRCALPPVFTPLARLRLRGFTPAPGLRRSHAPPRHDVDGLPGPVVEMAYPAILLRSQDRHSR